MTAIAIFYNNAALYVSSDVYCLPLLSDPTVIVFVIMIMIMIMIVFRVEAGKPVHPLNCIQ